MKIRNGFVSNSSSSSFVFAWKGDYDEDDLRLMFRVASGVAPESPIFGFTDKIFYAFMENVEDKFDTMQEFIKWTEENCYMLDDFKEIKALLEEGFLVRWGRFSTEDGYDPIEHFYASHEFNYKSDDLVIIHEGVY